jgi:hypothetical protein
MESTWEQRDLPVLDAIVRYFDEDDSAVIPDVATFAEITGIDPGQVGRAVRALSPRFIKTAPGLGGLTEVGIMGVTDEARQAVGQWPSPEVWVDRLVRALREAAERGTRPGAARPPAHDGRRARRVRPRRGRRGPVRRDHPEHGVVAGEDPDHRHRAGVRGRRGPHRPRPDSSLPQPALVPVRSQLAVQLDSQPNTSATTHISSSRELTAYARNASMGLASEDVGSDVVSRLQRWTLANVWRPTRRG